MKSERIPKEARLRIRKRTIIVLLILILIIIFHRCGGFFEIAKEIRHGEIQIPIEIIIRGNGEESDEPDTPPDNPPDNPPVNPPVDEPDTPDEPDEPVEPEEKDPTAVLIELSADGMDADKESMVVQEMYPGDVFTKYYCIKLTCEKTAKLRFYALPDLTKEDLKLLEVLKIKATVWTPDSEGKYTKSSVIYDGLVKDVKSSVEADQSKYISQDNGETNYFYELSVYLDTSVGNEYQHKSLTMDYIWELVE